MKKIQDLLSDIRFILWVILLIVAMILFHVMPLAAQEIGYTTGFTKQGINPASIQPIYGITLQKQFTKCLAVESDVFYSQRMNGNKIQADYLTFLLIGKAGYFGNRIGLYAGYGLSANPTLDHSNPENHSYLSFAPSMGMQVRVFKNTYLEVKGIYDYGLTGAYLKDKNWYKYKGMILMTTLKFKLWTGKIN